MTYGDFIRAKEAINNNEAVSALTVADLVVLKEQYRKHVDKLTVIGDIKQALWFRERLLETADLVERAKVIG